MLRLIGLMTVIYFSAVPVAAEAAASAWSVSEGGRMRVAALSPQADGTVEAVLEIDIKPGWKTYWREPGASGLAPQLDFGASQNLMLEKVGFPTPDAIGKEKSSFNGYEKPVSLTLNFRQPQPGLKSVLEGSVLVGVCNMICIPFTAHYRIALDPAEQVSADVFGRVKLAQTFLPEKPGKDFAIISAELNAGQDELRLFLTLPHKTSPEIFILPPAGFVIGKSDNILSAGGKLLVRLLVLRSPKRESLKDKEMTVLIKSGARAMEAKVRIY